MSDVLSSEQRGYCMSQIRGKDTKPELLIRKGLFALGFRYRLHRRGLPGSPDLVLPKHGAAIFVHGCFWHRHGCPLFRWPKTNAAFWRRKIEKNRKNDIRNVERLNLEGWRVLTVWECALRGRKQNRHQQTVEKVARWLASGRRRWEI